jgi:DNA-binding XRE family transcriptional regulator
MKNYDLIWAREFAGINQQQLADLLGTTRFTVSRWETGARPLPKHKWAKVLEALKLTREQIPQHVEQASSPPAPQPVTPAPIVEQKDPQKLKEEWRKIAEKHKARKACLAPATWEKDPTLCALEDAYTQTEFEFYTARDGDMCAVEAYKRTRTPHGGAPDFTIFYEVPRLMPPEEYLDLIGSSELEWPEAAVEVFREYYGLDLG